MNSPILSVIICTYNPRIDYFVRTLQSLQSQVFREPKIGWELLIIDNASVQPVAEKFDFSWKHNARIIREEQLGLTFARLRSFHEARGEILVYVDDDNILAPDYLQVTIDAFNNDNRLGAVGGRSLPVWEMDPPTWFDELGISLACRDLGEERIESHWDNSNNLNRKYPDCAPIGAGMGIRKCAFASYVNSVSNNSIRTKLGRRGNDLSSGEDNDMILSILVEGWKVAYLPELILEHLIPAKRLSISYLENYIEASNRTWVQVLALHGICPWTPIARWTLPIRKLRSWLHHRAWRSYPDRIRWRGACGNFEGRALLAFINRL